MQVLAAVARTPGQPFSLETLELDTPRDDEILIKIVAVGLCHTDITFRDVTMALPFPAVLGHEGAGIVEAVGAGITKVKAGDRVGITFRSCGLCARCKEGLPSYCATMPALNFSGRRPDGSMALRNGGEEIAGNFFGQSSFATYALAYERNVVPVPDTMPLELVGPLGCGIQTGAGAIMNSLRCERGSSLVVFGGGSVGLSAVMAAVVQGCGTIVVVEPHAARRSLAMELGATHTIDPKSQDVTDVLRAILPTGSEYAFDTTGRDDNLEAAMTCLGPRGVLGMVAADVRNTEQRLPGRLLPAIGAGLTLKGIIEGDSDPDVFIPELIRLYNAGQFPFDRLIKTFPFVRINDSIAAQHNGECVKVVLLMD